MGLSAAPLPDWARPLDAFQHESPLDELLHAIFRRAQSSPRPGDVAAADFALTDESSEAPEEVDAPKPEQEVAVDPKPPPREVVVERWKAPPRPKYASARASLGLQPAAVETVCAFPLGAKGAACERESLDRFFERLFAALGREARGVVRVVHYGDSIIASDHITDVVRLRLQERFGSGGKGFLLVSRYNARQRRLRSGEGRGWKAEHIAQGRLPDHHFGYAGSAFTAELSGASTEFRDLGASRYATLFYFARPGGGAIELFADDRPLPRLELTASAPAAEAAQLTLPEGTKTLRIVAIDAGVRLFGAALEARVPGVIYESIGVPGTTSETWLLPEETGFAKQLALRDPSLVVTMLGGNDARAMYQKRKTAAEVEASTRGFIQRLQRASPRADCLIVSPLDGVTAKASGEMKSKPEVAEVVAIQRKVARELGCGFWDMHASMGGPGALRRWFDAGLINPDLIHPRAAGGDILGEMMAEALMNAYDDRVARLEAGR